MLLCVQYPKGFETNPFKFVSPVQEGNKNKQKEIKEEEKCRNNKDDKKIIKRK